MTVQILTLSSQELTAVRDQILAVYQAAFAEPPYFETEEDVARFAESFTRHAQRAGFRCCVAEDNATGQVLGFAYGYTSQAGQWWYDRVAAALDQKTIAAWLNGAFEFVELAVIPSMQGQGIGGRLHDALLADLPHRTAVLSTYQVEIAALRLYHRKGWLILLQDYFFPGSDRRMVIMGFDLAKRTGAT
jgi:ribosomal protein S18 acetylase RimI-like enzyme